MSPILISQRVAGGAKKPRMWIGRWTLTGHYGQDTATVVLTMFTTQEQASGTFYWSFKPFVPQQLCSILSQTMPIHDSPHL